VVKATRIRRDVARILSLGGHKLMASAEREPITGVWGQNPQRGLGAEPLVGGPGAKPPEAERVLAVGRPVEAANFPHSMHF